MDALLNSLGAYDFQASANHYVELPQGCAKYPLFQSLKDRLSSLTMETIIGKSSTDTAVSISHDIYSQLYEPNPTILTEDCPYGTIAMLVYLSIAQDIEWKHMLLHRASYLLYSLPQGAENMKRSLWPINDDLIVTLYRNGEKNRKPTAMFAEKDSRFPPKIQF